MKRHPHQRHRNVQVEGDVYRDGRLHNFATPEQPKPPKGDAINLTQQTWDVTNVAAAILGNRPNRKYFLIQNLSSSASTVYVAFGTVASSTIGFELPPGNTLEIKNPCFADTVYVVAVSTATVRYAEG